MAAQIQANQLRELTDVKLKEYTMIYSCIRSHGTPLRGMRSAPTEHLVMFHPHTTTYFKNIRDTITGRILPDDLVREKFRSLRKAYKFACSFIEEHKEG